MFKRLASCNETPNSTGKVMDLSKIADWDLEKIAEEEMEYLEEEGQELTREPKEFKTILSSRERHKAGETPEWDDGPKWKMEENGEMVKLREALRKKATIRHEKGKWVVKNKAGDKILGTHDTKEEAEKQLRAIEMNKHSRRK